MLFMTKAVVDNTVDKIYTSKVDDDSGCPGAGCMCGGHDAGARLASMSTWTYLIACLTLQALALANSKVARAGWPFRTKGS